MTAFFFFFCVDFVTDDPAECTDSISLADSRGAKPPGIVVSPLRWMTTLGAAAGGERCLGFTSEGLVSIAESSWSVEVGMKDDISLVRRFLPLLAFPFPLLEVEAVGAAVWVEGFEPDQLKYTTLPKTASRADVRANSEPSMVCIECLIIFGRLRVR